MRKRKKRRFGLLFWLLPLGLLVFFAFDPRLRVSRYTVESDSLPPGFDGFSLVQISDLHCARFGEEQQTLLARIQQLDPNIVVLTGDIIDEQILDFAPVEELVQGLAAHWPVYSVWGNHDRWLSRADFRRLQKIYDDAGVITLADETVSLSHNGDTILLHGADDIPVWSRNDLAYAMENGFPLTTEADKFNLLFIHRANLFPAFADMGFDLALAGHMHGGQARIPYVAGVISPTREWFPPYTAGRYTENNTVMLVSRGLGNAIAAPRLFNPAELVYVVLRSLP